MKITAKIQHLNEKLAVCALSLQDEGQEITLCASARVAESARYPELAQVRAMALAQQVLQEGIDSVQEDDYLVPTAKPAPAGTGPAFIPPASSASEPVGQPVEKPAPDVEAVPEAGQTLVEEASEQAEYEVIEPGSEADETAVQAEDDDGLVDIPW